MKPLPTEASFFTGPENINLKQGAPRFQYYHLGVNVNLLCFEIILLDLTACMLEIICF